MYLDISLIVFLGYFIGKVFEYIKLPKIIGMIIGGMIIGSFGLDLLTDEIITLSPYIRKTALIIILIRAGLALKVGDLKEIGTSAIMLSFLPALFEIGIITLVAPMIFEISYLESGILGAVIAGVSPAIIVPRMLKILKEKYGMNKKIPQLILAGSSVDDIFVLLIFYGLVTVYEKGALSSPSVIIISIVGSIIIGVVIGVVVGVVLVKYFKKYKITSTYKVLIIFTTAVFVTGIYELIEQYVLISDLVTIMVLSITILNYDKKTAKEMSSSFLQLWIVAEIFLFVLVGVTVNVKYIFTAGVGTLLLIVISLSFRSIGTYLSVSGRGSNLNRNEKIMCIISYIPKATVQAGIGGIPLTLGMPSGELILVISVIYIIVTAPVGAFLIDNNYKKLLIKEKDF